MLIILIRTVILYCVVLTSIRLMGKSQLSEMQPFELVVILMVSELATLSIEDITMPFMNVLIAILTILLIQSILSYVLLKSSFARRFICGKPSILIDKGRIVQSELSRLRISMDDLNEQLRIKNYPILDDIEYAIMETNGDISIIPKQGKRCVTLEDIDKILPYEGLPITIIMDGHFINANFKKFDIDINWIKNELLKQNISEIKDVFFCCLYENNKIFVQKKDMGGNYK